MFERWENRLYEMYYGRECDCDDHCDGNGRTTPEDDEGGEHTCCQCHERDPEPYINDFID